MKDYKKLLKVVEFSQNDPADNQVDYSKLNNTSSNELLSSTSSPKASSNEFIKQGQVSANNFYSHNTWVKRNGIQSSWLLAIEKIGCIVYNSIQQCCLGTTWSESVFRIGLRNHKKYTCVLKLVKKNCGNLKKLLWRNVNAAALIAWCAQSGIHGRYDNHGHHSRYSYYWIP